MVDVTATGNTPAVLTLTILHPSSLYSFEFFGRFIFKLVSAARFDNGSLIRHLGFRY
jgi:hypothetical protein